VSSNRKLWAGKGPIKHGKEKNSGIQLSMGVGRNFLLFQTGRGQSARRRKDLLQLAKAREGGKGQSGGEAY